MIGEVRDSETARIAVQAALTGHLVLSTLHTNDAPSSVTRLVNIGVEPYLIAASLNSIMAQRLVRKICPKCKQQYKISRKTCGSSSIRPASVRMKFSMAPDVRRAEIRAIRAESASMNCLLIDDPFRDMITKDPSITNMRKAFAASNQASLYDDGIRKIKMGLTTLEEVLRVTEASSNGAVASEATAVYVSEPEHFKVDTKASAGPIQIMAAARKNRMPDSDAEDRRYFV